MDVLMPLAASVVCREGGLSPEDSIAMTAAALLIEGPLALAPAIVAVESLRGRDGGTKTDEIGPALVQVPDVVNLAETEAIKQLADAGLDSRLRYNRATDQEMVGKVLRQSPSGKSGLVAEHTVVELNVASGEASVAECGAQVTDAELEAGLNRVQAAVDTRLAAMEAKLDRTLELLAANTPKAQGKA